MNKLNNDNGYHKKDDEVKRQFMIAQSQFHFHQENPKIKKIK